MSASRQRARSSIASGLPGAAYHPISKRWFARISQGGERKHLGYFDTPEEASAVYVKAKREWEGAKEVKAVEVAKITPRPAPWRDGSSPVLDREVMELLFAPSALVLRGPSGNWAARNPFEGSRFPIWAAVSKRLNVSLYTVSSVDRVVGRMFVPNGGGREGMLADIQALYVSVIQRLQREGLIDRAPELATRDLPAPFDFDVLIAELLGLDDCV